MFTIIITSCGQSDIRRKELELKERELSLKEKELALKEKDTTSNSAMAPNTTIKTPPIDNDIPKSKVPIVKAANILPTWSPKEDIEGNYPMLSGLYVGAIGQRTIKIIIETVDTLKKALSGYSVVGGNQSAFDGSYTLNIRQPKSNTPSNVIDFITYEFKVILYESRGINKNGVFQLQFDNTDAQGKSGKGTWVSYDGTLYRQIKVSDTVTAQDQ
jgi:hypothetical protein